MLVYYMKLLWGPVSLLCAAIIIFASEHVLSVLPSTAYQLLIGGLLIWIGIETGDIAITEKYPRPILINQGFYAWSGVLMIFWGFIVFVNLGRYQEIISMWGTWPLFVMGDWLFLNGLLLVIHYLTVYYEFRTDIKPK